MALAKKRIAPKQRIWTSESNAASFLVLKGSFESHRSFNTKRQHNTKTTNNFLDAKQFAQWLPILFHPIRFDTAVSRNTADSIAPQTCRRVLLIQKQFPRSPHTTIFHPPANLKNATATVRDCGNLVAGRITATAHSTLREILDLPQWNLTAGSNVCFVCTANNWNLIVDRVDNSAIHLFRWKPQTASISRSALFFRTPSAHRGKKF